MPLIKYPNERFFWLCKEFGGVVVGDTWYSQCREIVITKPCLIPTEGIIISFDNFGFIVFQVEPEFRLEDFVIFSPKQRAEVGREWPMPKNYQDYSI